MNTNARPAARPYQRLLCRVLLLLVGGAFLASCDSETTPPTPPPPPKPPVNYAANFELYRKHLRLEHRATVSELASGVLRPVLLLKLTNTGPLHINHLKFAASVVVPNIYSERVEIEPFTMEKLRNKVLAPGGFLTLPIRFKARSLANPEEAMKMIKEGKAQYTIDVREVSWRPVQLNHAQAVALYAPHFGFGKGTGFAAAEVKDGKFSPAVRIVLVNTGPLNVNHLKFILTIDIDGYKDETEIAPFLTPQLRGRILRARGGPLQLEFRFNPKKVDNAEELAKKIKDGKGKIGVRLTEINFLM